MKLPKIKPGLVWRPRFREFRRNAIKVELMSCRLFTCNIWMLIKCYLSNYNGVIKATLPCGDSVPYISRSQSGSWSRSGPGVRRRPLLSTELQPPRSLSASHSCLNMSQDGGQCRIDVSILEALWLTTTTGQFVASFSLSTSVLFARVVSVAGGVLCIFSRRLVGVSGREFKSSSSHWWKWLCRWSEIDPLCSIQHRSDTATGQPGRRRGDAPT